MQLSDEQLKTIEINRIRALQRLRAIQNQPGPLSHSKTLVNLEMETPATFSSPEIAGFGSMFEQVSGAYYESKSRRWIFPLGEYQTVLSILRTWPSLDVRKIPQTVLDALSTEASEGCNPEGKPDLSFVDEFSKPLFPFQIAGIEFGLKKQGRVLIADEMGLGKTIQALGIALYYRSEWPLLVISPASLVASWTESICEWIPSLPMSMINAVYGGVPTLTGQVNIISYGLATNYRDEISKLQPLVVIVDECHYLKNPDAKRTKRLVPLIKKCRRVIMLSGTPALSRPIELFTLIQATNPRLFPNMIEFGKRYCSGYASRFGWDFKGASNLRELSVVLEHTIMIRRTKKDLISQLPSKLRQQVFLRVDPVKLQSLRQWIEEPVTDISEFHTNNLLLKFWMQTSLAKQSAVEKYIEELLERSEPAKLLVFAHHQHVLDGVLQVLVRSRIKFIRIDGSTPSAERQAQCTAFQTVDDIRVALLSITAAGLGLTLTAASIVVIAELFWNPGMLIQAEDRTHRIGQHLPVNIHYLLAQGTADDKLWPILLTKLQTLEAVGLAKNEFSNILSREGTQRSILEFAKKSDLFY